MKDSDENLPDNSQVFKNFSPNSRKILISAQKIAENVNRALSSEHILLALAITPGTIAHSILQENMISLDQIRLVISLQTRPATPRGEKLTDDARNIIKKGATLANKFRHHQVDPEHLLLAIITSEDSKAYQIILKIGSDTKDIKDQIDNLFSDIKDIETKTQMMLPKSPFLGASGFHEQGPKEQQEFFTQEAVASPPPQKNILDYFTVNISRQAKQGKIDPLIGREKEIQRVIQILSRRVKNNPVLVGEPGVGKTAIVEGIAQKINEGKVPTTIMDRQIIMLDLALLVAGTMYRGQFEDRIKKVMDELEKLGNVILFVDEFHTIVGAGAAEGSLDAANILKPSLAKGKIRLIGATTSDEYRKIIEKDSALERRLQKIMVEEPNVLETVDILKGLRPKYADFHQVKISDEAIVAAANLSKRYIADRFLPDKAIDLIDEASAAWRIKKDDKNFSKLKNMEKQVDFIKSQKEIEVEKQNFKKAAELKELEERLLIAINNIKKNNKNKSQAVISAEDIAKVVSLWTNIPVGNLAKSEKNKFLNLGKNLKKFIIGQDEAIEQIAQSIRRSKTGIADPDRPIGSFVFLGPTGVGKTELARILAFELFGSRDSIIKIDMSEFMEKHNVSRLLGAPPGYVGYEEAGRLTEEVRKKPYSIILFDEIEKAHPDIFNVLLQILEDGEITDAKGRKVNFRNTIIILTSNIGVKELNRQAAIGFQAKGSAKRKANVEYQKMKNDLLKQLKDEFRPELINRLDKIVVFKALDKTAIAKIIDLNLKELTKRLSIQGYILEYSPKIKNLILKKGFDPQFGARPIRRTIADLIEDPLSEQILSGKIQKDQKIIAKVIDNKVVFEKGKK